MRCLFPVIPEFEVVVMYMIQSEMYIFSPDFLQSVKKLDYDETKILWRLVFEPNSITLSEVMKIIYDPRGYGKKVLFLLFILNIL
jgi:hypothetical protein